jgi:hypothetical protein
MRKPRGYSTAGGFNLLVAGGLYNCRIEIAVSEITIVVVMEIVIL